MSRGMRWTKEQMSARGWRDPDPPRYEGADTVGKLNAAFRKSFHGVPHEARKPFVPYERDVLRAVLAALRAHPRVAWCTRVNSGMAMLPGPGGKLQPVRYGFEGCSDIIGQMALGDTTGHKPMRWSPGAFLAVEVKRPGRKPTMAQASFLLRVREAGGVGFVADSVQSVWDNLGKP